MNFDMDIYKEFMLYLSNHLFPNEIGLCEPIDPNKPLPNREQLAEITDNEIAYLIREFNKNNLIETKQYSHQAIPMITGITFEGYKFTKAISDENCWTYIKKTACNIKSLCDLILITKG